MFWHNFSYSLKSNVRDKQLIFWTLAFPVILGSLFGLAFSNLSGTDVFDTIQIGIVNTQAYQADTAFQTTLSTASKSDNTASKSDNTASDPLFAVTQYASQEEAAKALTDGNISGYIMEDSTLHLYIRSSGLNQTIMKEFTDWYLQESSAVRSIVTQNPSSASEISGILSKNITYISETKSNTNAPNDMLTYYYALIAMACMYGSFLGMKQVMTVQANQTPTGARIHLAPLNKLKIFASSLCAATLIQYISILILIGYLAFVLKIDFGNQLGYILLASFAGCCTGVSFGAMVGALSKKGEGVKTGIIISLSMLMSFLAGLMVAQVKYEAVKSLPILAYINPANLIADSFYALYYYNTYGRFFTNVGFLFGFSLLFYFIVFLVMRRQNYASL